MRADSEAAGRVDQLILARRDAFAAARDLYITVALGTSGQASGRSIDAYDRDRPIFVQYLNPEILACYGIKINGAHADAVLTNALKATRLAILVTNRYLIFPSSYIFEVTWFATFLKLIGPLLASGHARCTSPVSDLAVYRDIKALEYRRDDTNAYRKSDAKIITGHRNLIWTPRPGRTTADDISDQWRRALSSTGDLSGIVRSIARRRRRTYARVERTLEKTPERLDGQAFIKRFVERTLPAEITQSDANSLAHFLSGAYLRSYITDFDAMILRDLPIGELSCGIESRYPSMKSRLISARKFDTALGRLRVHDYVHRGATWDELVELRSSVEFGAIASAIADGLTLSLAFAILAARKSPHFRTAESFSEATDNIAIVADELELQCHS